LFQRIERLLLAGGIADMEAVASNKVSAARIRTRLRAGLVELERRVRPRGRITVVAQ
jgi:hypothetical protein